MRVVAFILSVVITTGLLTGGVFFVVLHEDGSGPVWFFVTIVAMTMFLLGPLTLGSIRAYWDVTGSEESRRYFRRALLVVAGLQVVAAIVIVASAVTSSADAVVPIVLIGGGAVLTVGAFPIGKALYDYDVAHRAPTSAWVAIEPSEIRKRIIAAAVTFVGVLVLGIVGIGLLDLSIDNKLAFTQVLSFALEFAFIFSASVCIFSTIGWNRRIRDVTDRDPARLRRVARVVLGKKQIELDDADLVAAARYAAVVSVTMPFHLAYILLLYAGILLQQVSTLRDGIVREFSIAIIVFLVALLVLVLPLLIVRTLRARRYARRHAALLDSVLES